MMLILNFLDFIINVNIWWDKSEEPKRTLLFLIFVLCTWMTVILNSSIGIIFISICLFYRIIYLIDYSKIIQRMNCISY